MNDKNRLGSEPARGPKDAESAGAGGANGERNKAKKNKKGNIITLLIIAAAAAVMAFAIYNLADIGTDYAEDADAYASLRAYAEMPALDNQGFPIERRTVDFNSLRAINDEIVAWVTIPGTALDYPVVHGEDNDFYISHGFDRQENNAGAVFTEVANAPDFSDKNTILYGHNMKDGSMFAMLHDYENKSFQEAHPFVFIYTPDGEEHVYRIFSAYKTPEDSQTYTIGFADDAAFGEYAAKMKSQSGFYSDIAVSETDSMITLSTCVNGEDANRYVIQAVKMVD